jgi:hypothetical protein
MALSGASSGNWLSSTWRDSSPCWLPVRDNFQPTASFSPNQLKRQKTPEILLRERGVDAASMPAGNITRKRAQARAPITATVWLNRFNPETGSREQMDFVS